MDYSKGTDVQLCINEANAFYDVALYCAEIDRAAQAKQVLFASEAFYFFPAIINLSFSVELYLKALVQKYGIQYQKVHGIKGLYDDLPPIVKDTLAAKYQKKCPYPVSLTETLEVHDQAFIKWRYAFEPKNHSVVAYFDNLKIAADTIREVLVESETKNNNTN